jgi:hypothetical protein
MVYYVCYSYIQFGVLVCVAFCSIRISMPIYDHNTHEYGSEIFRNLTRVATRDELWTVSGETWSISNFVKASWLPWDRKQVDLSAV